MRLKDILNSVLFSSGQSFGSGLMNSIRDIDTRISRLKLEGGDALAKQRTNRKIEFLREQRHALAETIFFMYVLSWPRCCLVTIEQVSILPFHWARCPLVVRYIPPYHAGDGACPRVGASGGC